MEQDFGPHLSMTRRQFLGRTGAGVGSAALAMMLADKARAQPDARTISGVGAVAPRAKRIIMLTQAGAPSQIDMFDHKPGLVARRGEPIPDSVRMGQRVTTMTSNQKQLLLRSQFAFAQHGRSGAWMSELIPHTARIADETNAKDY